MKKIHDFSDLAKNTYHLSLSHFHQGLDPNLVDISGTFSLLLTCYNEKFQIEQPHLLNTLLYQNLYHEDVIDFVAETIIKLKNNIKQQYINEIAFSCISFNDNNATIKILNALKDNGMLDINAHIRGYNMLACTHNKSKIEWLIASGCDIYHKVNNKESPNYNKTVFEMALESKKKGWVDILTQYLPQDLVNNKFQSKLTQFQKEKKITKQLKFYIGALKEKNNLIIDEIINNQNNYRQLIALEDGIGKNLIRYAVGHNSNDVLEKIIKIDYYQKNKTVVNKKNTCYTTDAISLGKNVSAKILYLNGFKDDNCLFKFYEKQYPFNENILSLMIDNGYKPNLNTRFHNFCYHKLEDLDKKQIDQFFSENLYILNLKFFYGAKKSFYLETSSGNYVHIKDGSFKLLSLILAQQEKLDPKKFEENFYKIMGGLGQNTKQFALRFGSILLENFPSKNLIDYLGYYGNPTWLTELSYEKLSNELDKIKYDDKPIIKKLKI